MIAATGNMYRLGSASPLLAIAYKCSNKIAPEGRLNLMPFHSIIPFRRLLLGVSAVALTAIAVAYGASRTMLQGQATDISASTTTPFPDPTADLPLSPNSGEQTAVFAGGCFWGMEAVFEHLKGVTNVVSGYSGGSAATAHYEEVGSGSTGHAESIQITYDPSKISYGQLLKIYFAIAHDPTELNRQGPDIGTQYRSAIFFANAQQQQVAQAYIDQLNQTHIFRDPIVTQLEPFKAFYAAEAYHQNFIDQNPNYPYVVFYDLPKLKHLQETFPNLYR
ncbi:MAG TPA: peptide-methionine (S)-S-oxide reductase MsrA [Crinalium sp.]